MAVEKLNTVKTPLSLGAYRDKCEMETLKNREPLKNNESGRTGRLQLVLPEQSFQRLEAIKEVTEAASLSEVIRVALRIYEGLLAEKADGSSLVVKRTDGEEVEIPLRLVVR